MTMSRPTTTSAEFGVGFTVGGQEFCLVEDSGGEAWLWHNLGAWHCDGKIGAWPLNWEQEWLAEAHLARCPLYQARLTVAKRGGTMVIDNPDDGVPE